MTILPIEYIVSTPDTANGQPRIAGSRIRVVDIAIYDNAGWTATTIAGELDLSLSQVYAALSYYLDHKDDIDQAIQEANKLTSLTPASGELTRKIAARKSDG